DVHAELARDLAVTATVREAVEQRLLSARERHRGARRVRQSLAQPACVPLEVRQAQLGREAVGAICKCDGVLTFTMATARDQNAGPIERRARQLCAGPHFCGRRERALETE